MKNQDTAPAACTAVISPEIDRKVPIPGLTGLFSVRTVIVDVPPEVAETLAAGSHSAVTKNGSLVLTRFPVPIVSPGQELAAIDAATSAGWQAMDAPPPPGRAWALVPLASGARPEHLLDRAEAAVREHAEARAAWLEQETQMLAERSRALLELKAGARSRVPDLARRLGISPSRVHNMARQDGSRSTEQGGA